MNKLQGHLLLGTQESLLHRIANRIRQSLELKEILNAMVAEVRDYLGTDRVKVYQFNPDNSGVVIAESIHNNRLPSLLGLNFPADDQFCSNECDRKQSKKQISIALRS